MALTVTDKIAGKETQLNGGALHFVREHVDVTEYAAGGWAPKRLPAATVAGIVVIRQENADYNFRWDKTNKKVLAYVMNTGAEAGAVDVGEVEYLLVTTAGP